MRSIEVKVEDVSVVMPIEVDTPEKRLLLWVILQAMRDYIADYQRRNIHCAKEYIESEELEQHLAWISDRPEFCAKRIRDFCAKFKDEPIGYMKQGKLRHRRKIQ